MARTLITFLFAALAFAQIPAANGPIPGGSGGGGSTSVTLNGTANQITLTGTCTSASAVTCTFSLPSNVVLPGTINSLTFTTSTGTLTIANAKTVTVNNTVTWTGTDGSTLTFGNGGTIFYTSTTLGCSQMPVLTGDVSNTNCAVTVSNGSHITNSSIPNSGLVNTGTTVNGQTCTLGGTCTVTAGLTLIQTQTLASPAATITFSSIPQTYTHLQIDIMGRSALAAELDEVYIEVNGDSGSHYYNEITFAINTTQDTPVHTNTAAPGSAYIGWISGASANSSAIGTITGNILNYTGTTYDKAANFVGGELDATPQTIVSNAWWKWTGTTPAAITTLAFALQSTSNFATGTSISLYGF